MTRMTWVCLVAYGYMLAISLYKVIGRIRVMNLHLGVVNGGGHMIDRAWDHVRSTTAKVGCPGGPGGDICTRLCVYAFGYVLIVLYNVRECNINVLIDTGEVD